MVATTVVPWSREPSELVNERTRAPPPAARPPRGTPRWAQQSRVAQGAGDDRDGVRTPRGWVGRSSQGFARRLSAATALRVHGDRLDLFRPQGRRPWGLSAWARAARGAPRRPQGPSRVGFAPAILCQ